MKPTRVIGTVHFDCGTKIAYDDSNPQHQANRLHRTVDTPLVDCPAHGAEHARCACSGPARLLWPDPVERAEILRDLAMDREISWAECA